MTIPQQLQKPEFRFVLLKPKEKKPFEDDWQHHGYKYDDPKLLAHIAKGGNYGVIAGYGRLRFIDVDDANRIEEVKQKIGETLTVKTGSGKRHFYILSDYDTNHVLKDGLGEYRATNMQCVCVGSTHPSGNKYEVFADVPIKEYTTEEIQKLLAPYLRAETTATTTTLAPSVVNTQPATTTDDSRSGVEFGEVCRLLKKGWSDEEVHEHMFNNFIKWRTSLPQYRQRTLENAKKKVEAAKAAKEAKAEKNKVAPSTVTQQFTLNPEEQDEAENILEDPLLLDILKREVSKKVEGEEDTIQTIILVASGALYIAEQTPPTYTLVLNSPSATGKDYTVSKTLELFPKERVIRRTRVSERALTYWHNSRFEPDWTWDGKILYLSDVSNAVLNCEVVKTMVTEGSHATIVINQMAIDIEVKGKPGIIGTIANASPSEETASRFPFAKLDETTDQTLAIMKRQANSAEKGAKTSTEYDKAVLNALCLLERVNVIIPYASILPQHFKGNLIIMRRNFDRILKYIAASAALHQYQRERNENNFVIATPEDYEHARIAIQKIASNPNLIPLTREDRQLIEYALSVESFSAIEAGNKVPSLQKTSLYEHLGKLVNYGLLNTLTEHNNFGKPVTKYSKTSSEAYEVKIPTWKDIEGGNSAISGNSGCPERPLKSFLQNNDPKDVAKNGITEQAEQANKAELTEELYSYGDIYLDKIISTLKPYPEGLPDEDIISSFPDNQQDKLREWIVLWLQHGELTRLSNGHLVVR